MTISVGQAGLLKDCFTDTSSLSVRLRESVKLGEVSWGDWMQFLQEWIALYENQRSEDRPIGTLKDLWQLCPAESEKDGGFSEDELPTLHLLETHTIQALDHCFDEKDRAQLVSALLLFETQYLQGQNEVVCNCLLNLGDDLMQKVNIRPEEKAQLLFSILFAISQKANLNTNLKTLLDRCGCVGREMIENKEVSMGARVRLFSALRYCEEEGKDMRQNISHCQMFLAAEGRGLDFIALASLLLYMVSLYHSLVEENGDNPEQHESEGGAYTEIVCCIGIALEQLPLMDWPAAHELAACSFVRKMVEDLPYNEKIATSLMRCLIFAENRFPSLRDQLRKDCQSKALDWQGLLNELLSQDFVKIEEKNKSEKIKHIVERRFPESDVFDPTTSGKKSQKLEGCIGQRPPSAEGSIASPLPELTQVHPQDAVSVRENERKKLLIGAGFAVPKQTPAKALSLLSDHLSKQGHGNAIEAQKKVTWWNEFIKCYKILENVQEQRSIRVEAGKDMFALLECASQTDVTVSHDLLQKFYRQVFQLTNQVLTEKSLTDTWTGEALKSFFVLVEKLFANLSPEELAVCAGQAEGKSVGQILIASASDDDVQIFLMAAFFDGTIAGKKWRAQILHVLQPCAHRLFRKAVSLKEGLLLFLLAPIATRIVAAFSAAEISKAALLSDVVGYIAYVYSSDSPVMLELDLRREVSDQLSKLRQVVQSEWGVLLWELLLTKGPWSEDQKEKVKKAVQSLLVDEYSPQERGTGVCSAADPASLEKMTGSSS